MKMSSLQYKRNWLQNLRLEFRIAIIGLLSDTGIFIIEGRRGIIYFSKFIIFIFAKIKENNRLRYNETMLNRLTFNCDL